MIIIASLLFLLDRIFKFIFLAKGSSYIVNTGMAFGILDEKLNWVIIAQIIITSLIFIYAVKHGFRTHKGGTMLLIITGSISNLIDRFVYNGVIDYIDISRIPKFNIADTTIVVGVILLLLEELYEYFNENHSKRK